MSSGAYYWRRNTQACWHSERLINEELFEQQSGMGIGPSYGLLSGWAGKLEAALGAI